MASDSQGPEVVTLAQSTRGAGWFEPVGDSGLERAQELDYELDQFVRRPEDREAAIEEFAQWLVRQNGEGQSWAQLSWGTKDFWRARARCALELLGLIDPVSSEEATRRVTFQCTGKDPAGRNPDSGCRHKWAVTIPADHHITDYPGCPACSMRTYVEKVHSESDPLPKRGEGVSGRG